MLIHLRRALVGLGLFAAAVMFTSLGQAQATEPISLRVVTFNLRFASANKPNSWPERRPVMRACIEEMAPDIMGTQEGVYSQLKDIATDLPDYDWIGLGRDGGSRGEFMAVFFRKARFEPIEFDHFWLSDTPNVIASTHWGNTNRRMTTWVRFRERASGREFYVFNTHLDHALRPAREKGARLIRQRVQEVNTDNLPVLLLGDFNAEPGKEKTYELFLEGDFLKDTWHIAHARRNNELSTFHNFKGATKGTFRIDWILTRGPWECAMNEVVVFSRNGQFPSDHHPVLARLRLRASQEETDRALRPDDTNRSASNTALIKHTDVYVSGHDGYQTYRIPAVETAPDGSLLAFAEGRKYGQADPGFDKQEIDLVMKRSTDSGRTWSAMKVIEHAGELWSAANPCTVVDRDTKRIWLFYLRGKPGRNTYTAQPGTDDVGTFVRSSDDNGMTWSEPIDLTAVARDRAHPQWRTSVVGPGGGIQSRDGKLAVPCWRFEPWGVFAVVSEDHGRTWRRGEFVPGVSGDECQLVELATGDWLFDIRQQHGEHRWQSISSDGGKTWLQSRAGESVTRVACAIERLSLKADGENQDRILWTGPKGPERSNLVARVSYDEGKTFSHERRIYNGPAAYSDLAILKDKTAGVLWERGTNKNYQFITFTQLRREWLDSKEATDSPPERK